MLMSPLSKMVDWSRWSRLSKMVKWRSVPTNARLPTVSPIQQSFIRKQPGRSPSLHFEEPPKKEAKLDIEEPLDLRTSLNSDQLNEKLPQLWGKILRPTQHRWLTWYQKYFHKDCFFHIILYICYTLSSTVNLNTFHIKVCIVKVLCRTEMQKLS